MSGADPTPTPTPEPGAAPPNATVCPTCGSPVVVEGGGYGEGTRYFRPVGYATELHAEIARLTSDLAASRAERNQALTDCAALVDRLTDVERERDALRGVIADFAPALSPDDHGRLWDAVDGALRAAGGEA